MDERDLLEQSKQHDAIPFDAPKNQPFLQPIRVVVLQAGVCSRAPVTAAPVIARVRTYEEAVAWPSGSQLRARQSGFQWDSIDDKTQKNGDKTQKK